MSRLRSVFRFNEFNPSVQRPDWKTITLRWALILAAIAVPVIVTLLQWVHAYAPIVIYMMAAVAALYVLPIALIRKPRVTVMPDFQIRVHTPKTVDGRLLLSSVGSAVAYFVLIVAAVLVVAR